MHIGDLLGDLRSTTRLRPGTLSPSVDLSGYRAESGVAVSRDGDRLKVEWPMEDERGQLVLDLRAGAAADRFDGGRRQGRRVSFDRCSKSVDPVCFLLVGSRQAPRVVRRR